MLSLRFSSRNISIFLIQDFSMQLVSHFTCKIKFGSSAASCCMGIAQHFDCHAVPCQQPWGWCLLIPLHATPFESMPLRMCFSHRIALASKHLLEQTATAAEFCLCTDFEQLLVVAPSPARRSAVLRRWWEARQTGKTEIAAILRVSSNSSGSGAQPGQAGQGQQRTR